jgi:formate dehydrogenase major subunit
MTDTAKQADLILPASFPTETGGSFTNTQKVIQEFGKVLESRIEKKSIEQIMGLLSKFGLNGLDTVQDVMMEAISLLPTREKKEKLQFNYTSDKNCHQLFDYGCDVIVKRFEEHFESSLK